MYRYGKETFLGKVGWIYLFISILSFLLLCCTKRDDVVIEIGKKKIGKTKLAELFEKNNAKDSLNRANIISQIIEMTILEEEAKKMGLSISKEEVESFIKESDLSEKHGDIARLYLLRQKVAKALSSDFEPPDERVEEKAKEGKEVEPSKYIFYQIVLNSEESAYKVLDEIKKGLPFEEAAKRYSITPEGKRGGLIDYLNADELPRELLAVLKGMKEGEISSVVKSPFGFHILKLKEYRKERKITAEEKMEMAKREVKMEMAGERYADWLAKKKEEYKVRVKWEEIEKIK